MGSLEQEVAAVSSQGLLAGLDFRTGQTADYILERQFQHFPCQTSVPNSVNNRMCRMHISEGSPFRWLDPTTLRFSFWLKNTSKPPNAKPMTLINGPWVLFNRARMLCRGVLVHDQNWYSREYTLWSRLIPQARIEDDQGEVPWETTLMPGESRRFMMWPGFGLCQTPQFIILEYSPLTFEFEMVATPGEAFVENDVEFEIWDPQMSADILLLDAAFAQQYSQSVLSGNPITYHHVACTTQMFIVPPGGAEFSLQMARSFSYVKTIWITFFSDSDEPTPTAPVAVDPTTGKVYVDGAAGGTAASKVAYFEALSEAMEFNKKLQRYRRNKKQPTFFYAAGQNEKVGTDETYMEVQAIWGSRTFPAQPIRGYTQMYSSLRRAIAQCTGGSVNITREQFETDSFIIGLNCERARSGGGSSYASYSGLSSMGGENLILQFKGMRTTPTLSGGKELRCFVTLQYDQSVRIRADGVEVLI